MDNLSFVDDFNSTNNFDTSIYITMQQRNGKKCMTFIKGLFLEEADVEKRNKNIKKFISTIKKKWGCGGSIIKENKENKDDDDENIVMIMGDLREQIKSFLITEKLYTESQIKIAGY
jgi:translation initiation factor SUI1